MFQELSGQDEVDPSCWVHTNDPKICKKRQFKLLIWQTMADLWRSIFTFIVLRTLRQRESEREKTIKIILIPVPTIPIFSLHEIRLIPHLLSRQIQRLLGKALFNFPQ